ncbi:MAG: right-handed parallel beta-helix repeat-containing protein [Marinilabiliaceae bacterium]|nr:right-handed parallel beta-helix repeat-containing protein [Marinilabiliaceae bacterium]
MIFKRLFLFEKFFCGRFFIFALLFCMAIQSFAQVAYNVSPVGAGVASLVGAKEDIRNTKVNRSSDVVVYLSDGIYFLAEPLVFDEEDGGQAQYSVTYKSAPGANPVISGGRLINGWEVDPDNAKLYRAKIDGINSFRNLYINGRRAKRARGSAVSGVKIHEEDGVKVGIVFDKKVIENYNNPEDVEINYTRAWRDHYFLVESIEVLSNYYFLVRIKNFKYLYQKGYTAIAPGQPAGPLSDFYFENALELLDQPGEWYYDQVSKYVYYYPFATEDMNTAEVIVPSIEQLVQIKSSSLFKKVENLNFEGIEFSHNDWSWPSLNGFYSVQASAVSGFGVPEFKLPGCIHLDGAKNIRFNNNIFRRMGSSAINIYNNTDSIFVESNSFMDISSTAISVAWKIHAIIDLSQEEGIVDHTFIRNNYIEGIGAEFKGSPGIESFYASNVVIDHNELYNMPYSGIAVGWGWSPALTTTKNVYITRNRITGVIQKANDGGAIYSLSNFGGKDGLLIEGNVIDELILPSSTSNEGSIYTDEQSDNVTIKNNIVKSTRKWVYYNMARGVTVDSMYVTKSVTNYGGNVSNSTDVKMANDHIWLLPNVNSQDIEDNAGIEIDKKPDVLYFSKF